MGGWSYSRFRKQKEGSRRKGGRNGRRVGGRREGRQKKRMVSKLYTYTYTHMYKQSYRFGKGRGGEEGRGGTHVFGRALLLPPFDEDWRTTTPVCPSRTPTWTTDS
jgi:hypothetical protein